MGVRQGQAKALELGLEPTHWPSASLGSTRPGFDDVMRAPNGDPVIVEYKGYQGDYGGYLKPGQMDRQWVQNNIRELIRTGDPMGPELNAALQQGRLSGVHLKTQIINGVAQPTQAFTYFWY